MPAAKKKKKPAGNPARGVATTSIASKPRLDTTENETVADSKELKGTQTVNGGKQQIEENGPSSKVPGGDSQDPKPLTAEEFEKQLEESELQLLVEKFADKVRRDASRQSGRLSTDKRLHRSGADLINIPKWLPQDIVDQVLDLIEAESRFTAASLSSDASSSAKFPPEDELLLRLWTLQQTLLNADFPQQQTDAAVNYILEIAPNVSLASKDLIWGLEEALDWLAKECIKDDLPPYEQRNKPIIKGASKVPCRLFAIDNVRALYSHCSYPPIFCH